MTEGASSQRGARLGEWLFLYGLSILAALVLSALLVESTGGAWR